MLTQTRQEYFGAGATSLILMLSRVVTTGDKSGLAMFVPFLMSGELSLNKFLSATESFGAIGNFIPSPQASYDGITDDDKKTLVATLKEKVYSVTTIEEIMNPYIMDPSRMLTIDQFKGMVQNSSFDAVIDHVVKPLNNDKEKGVIAFLTYAIESVMTKDGDHMTKLLFVNNYSDADSLQAAVDRVNQGIDVMYHDKTATLLTMGFSEKEIMYNPEVLPNMFKMLLAKSLTTMLS